MQMLVDIERTVADALQTVAMGKVQEEALNDMLYALCNVFVCIHDHDLQGYAQEAAVQELFESVMCDRLLALSQVFPSVYALINPNSEPLTSEQIARQNAYNTWANQVFGF